MSNLIIVNAEQFGLSEIQATAIANQFLPVIEEMQPLIEKYEEVKNLAQDDEKNSKIFDDLRKKFVKIRTSFASIHKDQKAFYLAGGKYVDSYKNKQLEISEPIEADLKVKADYLEIQESKRKEALRVERSELLIKFDCNEAGSATLANMTDNVFNMLLAGAEKTFNDKIEAEKQAEMSRLKQVQSDEEIQQEEIVWGLYYQRIADAEDAEIRAEKANFEASEKIRLADEKAKADVLKAKEDAQKAIKAAADKAEADRKEAEKQAGIKAENNRKAEAEKQRLAALAPDKEKLKKYVEALRLIPKPAGLLPESELKFSRFAEKMKLAIAAIS